MNNEILDNVRKCCDITKDQSFIVYQRQDILKLLDYITNLQQENEKLKTKTKEQSLLLIDYQDMEQKLEDYKSRIEKAVKYLKNNCYIGDCLITYEAIDITNVMDILNGRSDE